MRRAAREVFRNATRYYADLLYVPRMDVQRFCDEQLDDGGRASTCARRSESGRGAVMVSAHFGSPELAVQGLAAAGLLASTA